MKSLAYAYCSLNKIKEFPYDIKMNSFPLIEFTTPTDAQIDSESTLDKVAFFLEYTI
jgi:hypothetical protein